MMILIKVVFHLLQYFIWSLDVAEISHLDFFNRDFKNCERVKWREIRNSPAVIIPEHVKFSGGGPSDRGGVGGVNIFAPAAQLFKMYP